MLCLSRLVAHPWVSSEAILGLLPLLKVVLSLRQPATVHSALSLL